MRALSIRQPYAELILRGVKRIEYRSRPTRIIGERFWIYACKRHPSRGGWHGVNKPGREIEAAAQRIWSDDLAVPGKLPGEALPHWMIELAERVILGTLPTGVVVGSAVISRCREAVGDHLPAAGKTAEDEHPRGRARPPRPALYEWHLTGVEPVARYRKPSGRPQPVWFQPF